MSNTNIYSFSLHPETHQPSGTYNAIRLDNVQPYFQSYVNLVEHNKIKSYKIKSQNNLSCSVCFEDYCVDVEVSIFKCGHHFCTNCVKEWKKKIQRVQCAEKKYPIILTYLRVKNLGI